METSPAGDQPREAWGDIIGPMRDEVRAGRAIWVERFQMFFARGLPREEMYVTFSYSSIFAASWTRVIAASLTWSRSTS